MHLDVHGRTAELLAAGASTVLPRGEDRWDVLADPEGDESCVSAPQDRGPAGGARTAATSSRAAPGGGPAGTAGKPLVEVRRPLLRSPEAVQEDEEVVPVDATWVLSSGVTVGR